MKYIKPSKTHALHAFKEKHDRPHVILWPSAPASPSVGTLRLPRQTSLTAFDLLFPHSINLFPVEHAVYQHYSSTVSSIRVRLRSSSIGSALTVSITGCVEMIVLSQSQPCHEKSSLCMHMKHQSHL